MNEIAVKKENLPDTLEDLSRFVLIGREKLTAIKAEIRAIDKLNLAQDVRNQKRAEATMIGEAVLDAEVRLGELFREIPVNQGKRTDLGLGLGDRNKSKTKKEITSDLGFSKYQVYSIEAISENADIVEYVKAEARENDNLPTKARVLELADFKIKQKDDTIGEDEEYDKFLDASLSMYKKLSKITFLIYDFEITQYNMDALRDNYDGILTIEDDIDNINNAIDKLNKIKAELWKGKGRRDF